MKKLSICITSYNKQSKLAYLLKYLLKNISIDMQIYVFDNNSNQHLQKYLENLKFKKKIKLFISKRNFGEKYLIKKIQELNNSTYFVILAEDDFINLNYLKSCMKFMDNNTNINLIFSKTLIYNQKKENFYMLNSNLKNGAIYKPALNNLKKLSTCNIHLSSVFFRGNINNNNKAFNINIIDEQIFIIYLASKNQFCFFNKIGSSFTINESSQSNKRKIDRKFIRYSLNNDLSFLKKNISDLSILKFISNFSKKVHYQYNDFKLSSERTLKIKIIIRSYISYFKLNFYKHDINMFKSYYFNYDKK